MLDAVVAASAPMGDDLPAAAASRDDLPGGTHVSDEDDELPALAPEVPGSDIEDGLDDDDKDELPGICMPCHALPESNALWKPTFAWADRCCENAASTNSSHSTTT